MARRKHKGAAKHKGVTLVKRKHRDGSPRWMARYVDPRDGQRREKAVPAELTTLEQRRAWAASLATDIAELRSAHERNGAALTTTGGTLTEAVETYYRLNTARLRASTVDAYRLGTDALLAFAAEQRITKADDLRPAHLEAFRGWMFAAPKMVQGAVKGRQGARVPAKDSAPRSAVSVNSRIRSVKTVLEALRRLGLVPRLTRDALHDRLRREREPRPLPTPLKPAEAAKLIQAALRHDAETFTATRAEHAGRGAPGSTPRYEPIAPFALVLLFTGMREGEARALPWSAVDLDAGAGGEIRLDAKAVKTKQARLVDLSVSPLLRQLLRAMKLRAGASPYVFGVENPKTGGLEPYSRSRVEAARKRLRSVYGAPEFTWQQLRETCATYLANSSIFGAATAYREAKQLGHSVVVAERHYLGVVTVDPGARSLEAALDVEAEAARVVTAVGGEAAKAVRAVSRA